MKMHRLKKVLIAATASVAVAGSLGVAAQSEKLEAIIKVGEEKNQAARESQGRVDRLADEARSLLQDYKTVMKQVDGLKVYNERLERQIAAQEARLADIGESIEGVTVIQRQMTPLVVRMIDGLEQFVELDVPFHMEERKERVAFLRRNLDRSDVAVSEKMRQVLEAYKIENEYGRKIDAYKGTVEINGAPRDVNFLRIGRIALLYQTTDTEISGAWDQASRQFVELPRGEYRSAIMKGLRIARNEASIDIMTLPVPAPEAQ